MKKSFLTAGLAIGLICTMVALSGCSGNPGRASTPNIGTTAETTRESTTNTGGNSSFVHTVSYPESFAITYEVQNPDGTIKTVSKAIDSSGSVYFQSGAEELLFFLEGKTYQQYSHSGGGDFTQLAAGTTYNAQYVADYTKEFTELTETSGQLKMPTASYIGETQVVGRTCDVYEISAGFASFVTTYQLAVDQETGICLGWSEETKVGETNYEANGVVFICTEFVTEHITLPTNLH